MLLTGAATAACGPIGFVGLVVPHLARRFGGVDYRWLVPYSALLGALLVTVADVIGRVVVRPAELQVGIVMALIGGPAFVLLVRRTPDGADLMARDALVARHPAAASAAPRGWCPSRAGVVVPSALAVLARRWSRSTCSVGDFPIPVADVVRTLLGGGDAGQRFVVMELRLPQTVVAVAVGAALGLAGALTQTFARNPLASPDILGVTDGAAVGAVAVIVLAGGSGYGGGLVSGTLQELGLPARRVRRRPGRPPRCSTRCPGGAASTASGWSWSASASAPRSPPGRRTCSSTPASRTPPARRSG